MKTALKITGVVVGLAVAGLLVYGVGLYRGFQQGWESRAPEVASLQEELEERRYLAKGKGNPDAARSQLLGTVGLIEGTEQVYRRADDGCHSRKYEGGYDNSTNPQSRYSQYVEALRQDYEAAQSFADDFHVRLDSAEYQTGRRDIADAMTEAQEHYDRAWYHVERWRMFCALSDEEIHGDT